MNRRQFLLLTAALLTACGKKAPKHSALPRGSAVLALGDSLTYGYGANPTESYPARLAELTGWAITNGGVSGDTSAQALARLPELLREHTPHLVIISIGGNAFLRRQPENDHPLYADLAKAENVPYYANGWSQILGKDALKSDQIHPNAAGYAEFARGLTAYLKENGWLR